MDETMRTEGSGPVILILFPHNFTSQQSGVQKRFAELVRYFNKRGFTIDLLGVKNFHSQWADNGVDITIPGVRQIYLYDHSKGLKAAFLRNLLSFRFMGNRNLLEKRISRLPDYSFPGLKETLEDLTSKHTYDFILVSYVQWANLIRGHDVPRGDTSYRGKMILTIEDCLSWSIKEKQLSSVPVDQLLTEEASRVNLFDEVICISWQEMEYFANHAGKPVFHYAPVFMDPVPGLPDAGLPDAGAMYPDPPERIPDCDILFVGSANASNRKGMEWFFNAVYPLLDKDLKILCVGKITGVVPDHPNVLKINFREDLTPLYRQSKITISPMRDGTGMKVKIIESMAHGVPVVSTIMGLTGMKPDVCNNFMASDDPEEFAGFINRLITDKTLYLDYCQVMEHLFQDNFSTDAVTPVLDKVFGITKISS